jgi:cysteinyl-tRNA synthetase
MDDNLNTSVALASLHNLVGETNRLLMIDAISNESRNAVLNTIKRIDSVLNIFGEEKKEMLAAEIESLIEERQTARRNRNFARSDEIRDTLAEKGIVLEDTKDGVRWKRK